MSVLERIGVTNLKTSPVKSDLFSEGIAFSLGKNKLVEFGVINKRVLKEFGIKQEVLFADFDWKSLNEISGKKKIKVSSLLKFPSVKRDLALLIDEKVTFKEYIIFHFK